jgi:3-phosphoglycerate kinase
MSASNNFKCTPVGVFTLTFTNIVSQSGFILLVNSGGHTVSAAATSKVDANLLATVSTAGTYLLSYFSDGTNVYLTNSAIYA